MHLNVSILVAISEMFQTVQEEYFSTQGCKEFSHCEKIRRLLVHRGHGLKPLLNMRGP